MLSGRAVSRLCPKSSVRRLLSRPSESDNSVSPLSARINTSRSVLSQTSAGTWPRFFFQRFKAAGVDMPLFRRSCLLVAGDDEIRHPEQGTALVALRQIGDQSAGQVGVAIGGGECVVDRAVAFEDAENLAVRDAIE